MIPQSRKKIKKGAEIVQDLEANRFFPYLHARFPPLSPANTLSMPKYQRVMLIDDNEIDNIINEKIIEANNFAEQIFVFQTAQAGLDFLVEHQNDGTKLPEIIFLDINMPIMDGFQFLEKFQAYPDLVKETCKIIMLSSSISPKDIDRAASNRFVKKYLNKPLNARYLDAITV